MIRSEASFMLHLEGPVNAKYEHDNQLLCVDEESSSRSGSIYSRANCRRWSITERTTFRKLCSETLQPTARQHYTKDANWKKRTKLHDASWAITPKARRIPNANPALPGRGKVLSIGGRLRPPILLLLSSGRRGVLDICKSTALESGRWNDAVELYKPAFR